MKNIEHSAENLNLENQFQANFTDTINNDKSLTSRQ